MFSNRVYQIALVISVIAHTAIFAKFPDINFFSSPAAKDKIEVNYVREKPALPSLKLYNQQPSQKLSRQAYNKSIAPPPYVEKEKIFNKINNIPLEKPDLPKPEIIAVKKKVTLTEFRDKEITDPLYLKYYRTIRERIKNAAYQNYARSVNGEVYVSFVILNRGQLKDVKINEERSTAYSYLKDIAKNTIYDASPFPNFPQDLEYPELSFNVVIAFEAE